MAVRGKTTVRYAKCVRSFAQPDECSSVDTATLKTCLRSGNISLTRCCSCLQSPVCGRFVMTLAIFSRRHSWRPSRLYPSPGRPRSPRYNHAAQQVSSPGQPGAERLPPHLLRNVVHASVRRDAAAGRSAL